MTSGLHSETARRWGAYGAKELVLFGLLFALARFAPAMPPAAIAVCWAALSIVAAIGLAYHFIIRKVHKQYVLQGDGLLSRLNSGRMVRLTIAFMVSAALIAGLMLEAPKWDTPEWVVVAAAIPLYALVHWAFNRFLTREFAEPFQTSKTVQYASATVGALLCLAYGALCLAEPVAAYTSATQAFLGAPQPFAESPSALLADVGRFVALVDGLAAYGVAQVSSASFAGYLACKVVLSASAFFGVASLIGVCALRGRDLKLVFLPLDAAVGERVDAAPIKRCVALACVLPVALAAAFIAADSWVAQVSETQEYTAAETFVRDQAGLAAYVLDGTYYEQQRVKELIAQARESSAELAAEREKALTPLVNAAFDARIQNVDAYLDWYYSLPADYERLIQYFSGTVESGMQERLSELINEGVDETGLNEQMGLYLQKAQELDKELRGKLAEYACEDVPEWLIVASEPLSDDFLDAPLAPTQKFLDAGQRMGLSTGTGVVTGVIAKRVVDKILGKPFFTKIVAGLVEKLGMRGLLAEGGTIIAPGVGTVIGVGAGVVTDYVFLKADEAMNRESYKEEIVRAIEEARTEMLALVRAE